MGVVKQHRQPRESLEKLRADTHTALGEPTRAAASHGEEEIEHEAKLVLLRIEKLWLKQAEVQLSQAEVELKSKVIDYRIKHLAFRVAVIGVPATLAEFEWGWLRTLARWVCEWIA